MPAPAMRITLEEAAKLALKELAPKAGLAALDGPGIGVDIALTLWFCYDVYKIYKNHQAAEKKSSKKPEAKPSPLPKDGVSSATSESSSSNTGNSESEEQEDAKREPAPEATAKRMARQIGKDLGKDAQDEFHNAKDDGAPDRTMAELRRDASQIYREHGMEPPAWMSDGR